MECINSCKQAALYESRSSLHVDFLRCTACGDCIEECPDNALKIYGWETTTEEVMQEVLKDKSFYERSGGGMTLSGGEPMQQYKFSKELLIMAKKQHIHTCIETSGYAPTKLFAEMKDYTDLFLYDYKIYHERYTGVDNNLIINNLRHLHDAGKDIVMRCILIPGMNDNEEHFRAIADLEKELKNLKGIEIMPYHEYGKSKYATIGKTPFETGTSTVEDEQVEIWLEKFKSLGCKKVKRG